jgi:hypothetical protein
LGFIRYLYEQFDKELKAGGYHISTLQGIPEFFRQFGYDFLFPLGQFSQLVLRPDQIPRIWSEEPPLFMSLDVQNTTDSTLDDIIELYDEIGSRLLVRSFRTRELWELQERLQRWRSFHFVTKVITENNRVVGYLRYIIHGEKSPMAQVWESSALDVIESSISSYNGVMRGLYHLKDVAKEHQLPLIFLPITIASNLTRLCMDLGGQTEVRWKHQIRVPDMIHLLEQITPALEQHLVGTMFNDITCVLRVNTYSHCYELHFEHGKLNLIKDLGRQPWGDLSLRNHDFVRLIFGQINLSELMKTSDDVMVSGELVEFFNTLFPRGESFIHYYHC